MKRPLTLEQKQTLLKIHRVREVVKAFRGLEQLYDGVEKLVGVDPDAPLFRTTYDVFGKYLEAVAVNIGDQAEWLSWYVWENECGKRGGLVTWMQDGKEHKVNVRTPSQLIRVIEGHADK